MPQPRPRLLARPAARGSCDIFFLRTCFQSFAVSDGFVAGGKNCWVDKAVMLFTCAVDVLYGKERVDIVVRAALWR